MEWDRGTMISLGLVLMIGEVMGVNSDKPQQRTSCKKEHAHFWFLIVQKINATTPAELYLKAVENGYPLRFPRCFSRILTLNWGKSKCGMRPCRRCLLQESANPFVVHVWISMTFQYCEQSCHFCGCWRPAWYIFHYFSQCASIVWILWIRFGWDLQLKSLSQVNKMLPLLIESYNLMKNSSSEDKAAAGDTDVEDPKSHPRLQDWRLCRMLWFDFIR